ncbi:DUF6434 domain-containing protein [Methanobrevibacter sp. DSM 116169]|uniref:DUF6434 domain-containing protein n=1 Tax=Methanobrevibacter sp. DSM 116169 TaxID=3242727 RepID=UPI0038FC142B
MDNKRPELSKNLDSETFKNFYYLKDELTDFLKSEGLKTSGNKKNLTDRIIFYLDTGKEKVNFNNSYKKPSNQEITLNSKIGENFKCTEKNREFFKSEIGDTFKFKVNFQKWLKNNPNKSYKEAINAYYEIIKVKPKIDKQFEYNQYIKDFFKNNNNLSLNDAIKSWKYKKSLPGNNKYSKDDLAILNKL